MEHTSGEIKIKPGIGLSRVLFLQNSKGVNIGGVVDIDYDDKAKAANAERIKALWNAAPEDIEKAVAYLRHGAEIREFLLRMSNGYVEGFDNWAKELLTKLEASHD